MNLSPHGVRRATVALLLADCVVAAGLLAYSHQFLQEAQVLHDDTGIALDQFAAMFFGGPGLLALSMVLGAVIVARRKGGAGLGGATPFSLALTGFTFSMIPVVLFVLALILF